ncbi:MAG: nitrilase-related carbon-nitrogen hydrolase [Methanosarcinaceae archaeon]|nr:nitrilase-related carbon-nitrogen hydrolase [Methanosarcinaceae archaeon]
MKAACIQMDIRHCKKQTNINHALLMAGEAISKGAELIVFPEVFSTGFCYDNIEENAEYTPYPTIETLCEFSKEHNCILIGSIIEAAENEKAAAPHDQSYQYFNMGFCIESGNLAGTYKKTHPFGQEKSYFCGGDTILPIRLEKNDLTIGLEICYELRFPEIARKLSLEGADILVTIAEFPNPREHHWKTLAIARAIENQIPHIACNRAGEDPYSTFFGGSMIIDAWGEVKAQADDGECIIMHDIDMRETDNIRKAIPVFDDRRPDIY